MSSGEIRNLDPHGLKTTMTQLLTVSSLSDWLSLSQSTIYDMVKKREIPHILISSGKRKECVRFDPDDIKEWLASRKRKTIRGVSKWDLR